MKKLAIAGASLALAAMPVVGVFAATSSSFTDTLTVTVPGGCTLEDNSAQEPGTYADRAFSATIPAGTYKELGNGFNEQTGTTMKIACNTTSGTWTVTATASNGAISGKSGAALTQSASIEPGIETTGNDSAWAIKSNTSIGTGAANPYASYKAYEVDSGKSYSTFLTGSADAQTPVTFNPSYQVYVSPTQATGDYEGTVTYTVAMD